MAFGLPERKHREPAECLISVGVARQEIADLYPFLVEVVVETSVERATVATLRFETRRDAQGRWSVQDAEELATWMPIRIEAAFGDAKEEVLRGYIREIHLDYPANAGQATVTVECQDETLPMDREHVRREWGAETPTSDSLILQEIVSGRYGLTLHPDSKQGQSNLVLLQDGTDIRFLRERAEANGYELICREGEVYFGPMRLDAEAQDTILVYAGAATHCTRLSIVDDGHKPDRVAFDLADEEGTGVIHEVIGPDLVLLGTQPADSSASGLSEFTWRLAGTGGRSADEVRAIAQRKANEHALKVRAEGELDGSLYGHVLRVGEPVPVDGIGARYGGRYYVVSVVHRFNLDGYREAITLVRNAYGDDLAGAADPLSAVL